MPALPDTYLVIKHRRKRQTRGARTLAHRSGRFLTGLGGLLILILAAGTIGLTGKTSPGKPNSLSCAKICFGHLARSDAPTIATDRGASTGDGDLKSGRSNG